jgi:elongator complex protein 4
MSFRKRSVPLTSTARHPTAPSSSTGPATAPVDPTIALRNAPGVRISSILSIPTTSTGTPSLDQLLGLGAGLALGHGLAIEEHGTTDFAGALLRSFVSQGALLGHKVFVGAGVPWGANLPGLGEGKEKPKTKSVEQSSGSAGAIAKEVERGEKMKIAWRYERLGGIDGDKRGASFCSPLLFYICRSNKLNFCTLSVCFGIPI